MRYPRCAGCQHVASDSIALGVRVITSGAWLAGVGVPGARKAAGAAALVLVDGAWLVQVCHEGNTAVHAAEYEGRPERRPLTRAELQAFLDAADDHVERAASSRRKGWLAAFRDATLFKVVYGWGLRRRETAMLDVTDFAANPAG